MTEKKEPAEKKDEVEIVAGLGVDEDAKPVEVAPEPKTNKLMDEAKAPAPAPAPTPKVPKQGVYVLQQGDHPGSVSTKLYGRGHMAVPLVRANPGVLWEAGDEIVIP
jgi:hypothetical protein